eukprot:9479276-Pyramimonas_sp.AAC.1
MPLLREGGTVGLPVLCAVIPSTETDLGSNFPANSLIRGDSHRATQQSSKPFVSQNVGNILHTPIHPLLEVAPRRIDGNGGNP